VATDPALIEFREVRKSFGDKDVLRGMTLAIQRGEVLFIIGTSGVGKSVTIKHLIGLLSIDAGEIWFDGKRVDGLRESDFAAIRRRVGMVFQSSTLFDSMTLAENVALPLRKHRGMRQKHALVEARRRLDQVYMGDFADRYPAELSDGMRKRAAIARTLTLEPEVVLFDEPTTGLDPVNARRIDRLIRELAGPAPAGGGAERADRRDDKKRITAVVVSHDLTSIFTIADRIAFLYQGAVRAVGTPDEIRASPDPVVQQFIAGASSGPMETPGF
jgi:phospholipid/cholesterol/gamma-HCH transport system ATP-binding protein